MSEELVSRRKEVIAIVADIIEFLENSYCHFEAKINKYDLSHLEDSLTAEFESGEQLNIQSEFDSSEWKCSYKASPVQDRPDACEFVLTFKLLKGDVKQCAVGAQFVFENWSKDDYLVMPSAVYAGNRFKSRRMDYPPHLKTSDDIGVDVPTIITDVPRLNVCEGPSRIQLLTRDLSTPAIGIYFPETGKGFWLLTDQETPLGDSGINIEENTDRSTAKISLMAPGVREDVQYKMCNISNNPSKDHGADFKVNDELTLRFRIYWFDCVDIPALFDRFLIIRKDLSGPTVLRQHIPFSSAWAIQLEKQNQQNWDDEYGYYHVGIGESPYTKWQLGWVGGMMITHAFLFEGDDLTKKRALQNFEFFFGKTQAKSGFFYGVSDGRRFYNDGCSNSHAKKWHLIRKNSDALYFVMKQFMLLEKQDHSFRIPERWISGTKKLCDAFVRLWDRYGQFGQFVDIETGDIVVGGSTSAGVASAGLALAGQYFGFDKYLEVAIASAEHFYKRDVLAGVTTGGPGDILQCPDSESAFGLLESFVVLYEVTEDKRWINMAVDMANQCVSWCVSYDYHFPPNSLFGKLGMLTTGSVWANVQNKHSAPGICTLSGNSLFKLYRATGNLLYLKLLQEMAHNLTQYLSRADRPVGNMPPGWMNERVNLSDWEGKGQIGGIFHGSCWAEVSTMLTYVEVPGLYVQPDTGFVCAIDHIDVKVIKNDDDCLILRVTNPTSFKASVKVFSENSTEMSSPLSQNTLLGCKRILLEPGNATDVEFKIE